MSHSEVTASLPSPPAASFLMADLHTVSPGSCPSAMAKNGLCQSLSHCSQNGRLIFIHRLYIDGRMAIGLNPPCGLANNTVRMTSIWLGSSPLFSIMFRIFASSSLLFPPSRL